MEKANMKGAISSTLGARSQRPFSEVDHWKAQRGSKSIICAMFTGVGDSGVFLCRVFVLAFTNYNYWKLKKIKSCFG